MNKKYTTILLSTFLGLFLLGGFWYFNFRAQAKLPAQEIAQKAIDYLNDNLLPDGMLASLVVAIEKEDIIELSFTIADREYNSYVTKSGDLFFIEGIDLNEKIVQEEEVQGEIVKSEKPDVSFFVMSYCPYGLQAQKVFSPIYNLLSDKANINIRFVSYIMYGKKEIDENLRQYCIQKEQKEKYNDYVSCFIEEGSYEKENFEICLERVNIDQAKMSDCIVGTDQNYNVGTGIRTSLKELAELLIEITGCDKPINYAPRSQATLVRNRVGDPKRASEEIDFTAKIELKDGLERLIEWRSSHKAEVERRRREVGITD